MPEGNGACLQNSGGKLQLRILQPVKLSIKWGCRIKAFSAISQKHLSSACSSKMSTYLERETHETQDTGER